VRSLTDRSFADFKAQYLSARVQIRDLPWVSLALAPPTIRRQKSIGYCTFDDRSIRRSLEKFLYDQNGRQALKRMTPSSLPFLNIKHAG
jgi:hypothetical protein